MITWVREHRFGKQPRLVQKRCYEDLTKHDASNRHFTKNMIWRMTSFTICQITIRWILEWHIYWIHDSSNHFSSNSRMMCFAEFTICRIWNLYPFMELGIVQKKRWCLCCHLEGCIFCWWKTLEVWNISNVNLLIVLGRFLIFFVGLSVYAQFCDSLFMLRMNACTPSILACLLPVKTTAL